MMISYSRIPTMRLGLILLIMLMGIVTKTMMPVGTRIPERTKKTVVAMVVITAWIRQKKRCVTIMTYRINSIGSIWVVPRNLGRRNEKITVQKR